jgi:hypothetical protein
MSSSASAAVASTTWLVMHTVGILIAATYARSRRIKREKDIQDAISAWLTAEGYIVESWQLRDSTEKLPASKLSNEVLP